MEPIENPAEEFETPGELHHFQVVGPDGNIPMSISVLIRVHAREFPASNNSFAPISTNDVIDLHTALTQFDGNFAAAFKSK